MSDDVTTAIRGWWVGLDGGGFLIRAATRGRAIDGGGFLIRAATRGRAKVLGAEAWGVDFTWVGTLRVPVLDGTGPEGHVEWEDAMALGAARVCERCGWEFAVTARNREATLCARCDARGQCLRRRRNAGRTVTLRYRLYQDENGAWFAEDLDGLYTRGYDLDGPAAAVAEMLFALALQFRNIALAPDSELVRSAQELKHKLRAKFGLPTSTRAGGERTR